MKQKSSYRPTRTESVLAWVFTLGAGVAFVALLLRSL